ncbi:MAG: hypothetical protein UW90_C0008G0034, partial [Candidatus Yanofskybacteria bacterium GW2011_GWB1_45_11]
RSGGDAADEGAPAPTEDSANRRAGNTGADDALPRRQGSNSRQPTAVAIRDRHPAHRALNAPIVSVPARLFGEETESYSAQGINLTIHDR